MFVLFCSFLFYKQLIRPAETRRLYSKCHQKKGDRAERGLKKRERKRGSGLMPLIC